MSVDFGAAADFVLREARLLDRLRFAHRFGDGPSAPGSLARGLFDDATIEAHLDALAARQQADGGWPITWEPPTAAAVSEWRGFWTLRMLAVLDENGRLA